MQFKRFTEQGLRVLSCLSDKTSRPVAIAKIAEAMALSRNTVMKVMRFVVQQGWGIAVRGRTGGFMLAHPASDFRLGDICRAFEGAGCMIDWHEPPCSFRPACRLVPALAKGEEALGDALNEQTLADLHYGSLPDDTPPNGVIRIAEAA